MAVNGFVFGTYGNVTKSGNTYTMNLTIKVCDYYDWANEDEDPMDFPINVKTVMTSTGPVLTLVTVNETTLNDINRAGLGKNFESNGTILLNFSWTKGQQYNDIKEQIV